MTLKMGPDRASFGSESAYRLAWAAYSARWLLALGAGLLAMLAIRPWSGSGPAQFIVFFLYIGFGLGSLAALLASLAFLIGSLWSRWLQARPGRRTAWQRFKLYGYAVLVLLAMLMAYGCLVYGLLFGKTFFPSRRELVVSYGDHGIWFIVAMAFWLWACISSPRYAVRIFRQARVS